MGFRAKIRSFTRAKQGLAGLRHAALALPCPRPVRFVYPGLRSMNGRYEQGTSLQGAGRPCRKRSYAPRFSKQYTLKAQTIRLARVSGTLTDLRALTIVPVQTVLSQRPARSRARPTTLRETFGSPRPSIYARPDFPRSQVDASSISSELWQNSSSPFAQRHDRSTRRRLPAVRRAQASPPRLQAVRIRPSGPQGPRPEARHRNGQPLVARPLTSVGLCGARVSAVPVFALQSFVESRTVR